MYLFINGDSTISEKHCSTIESLPHDVVEQILMRLAAKSLMRFKIVSKQWKSSMESRFFQERQLMQRKQQGDPNVLMVYGAPGPVLDLRTLVVGSSSSVKIPTPWEENKETQTDYLLSPSSCDGLVCLYFYSNTPGFVLNPTTRWYRTLPLSRFQGEGTFYRLGFGKDKFRGTYKPVWLYNSTVKGRENVSTCEVFDFSTNAWRYVTPAAPYQVLRDSESMYVDGSLHWFTACEATKVISLDLHTEVFRVSPEAPYLSANRFNNAMCNLDNRLCITTKGFPNQVIWCLNSDNKTWNKVYTIDVNEAIPSSYGAGGVLPLAILEREKENKKKLLLCCREFHREVLVIHYFETKTYDLVFSTKHIEYPVCYFPSLISIL